MNGWDASLALALREFEFFKAEEARLFAELKKAERGLDFALRIRQRAAWFEMRTKARQLNTTIVGYIETMLAPAPSPMPRTSI